MLTRMVCRIVVGIGHSAEVRGSFVEGWHEGDEWWIRYVFRTQDGRDFEGRMGTGFDMVHAAWSGDTAELDRISEPGALRVLYLVSNPRWHIAFLPSGATDTRDDDSADDTSADKRQGKDNYGDR